MSKRKKEEVEAAMETMLLRERPEGELTYNEETWWDIEEKIQQFVITFYREHQRYPMYSAIAIGLGISPATVTVHMNGGKEVDDLYQKRLKRLARLYATKTMTALYNSAIKGNEKAALDVLALGEGLKASDILGKSSANVTVNTQNVAVNNDVDVEITEEEQSDIEEKMRKYLRGQEREKELGIVEGEVKDATNSAK